MSLKPFMSNLLTCREVAKQLGLSRKTVYKLAWDKKLCCQKVKGHIRFSCNNIKKYLSTANKLPVPRKRNIPDKYQVNLPGDTPFGYTIIKKHLVPLEKESLIVKLIFEFLLKYKDIDFISSFLNLHGIKTRYGTDWTTDLLKELLQDKVHKGKLKIIKRIDLQDNLDYSKSTHPAIVSDKDWLEAQRLLKHRRKLRCYKNRKKR